ncbi:flagellar filament capping protein FliD [Limnoglobus roseus]|uniref:Flagellar hook-associated protein 2 n=1 Tax=Limnoglobus roseus TaxID=2598579 RepID=A0A5C1A9R4_9BACT|nr:flagellar filament capping protein FliD [Limnoglobus roseus]QEL13788.1 flagellar capping protein [Limnoglobus roseus]
MATISSSGVQNTSGLNFGGLSTGIDSSTIIEGLTKLNQSRIDTLTANQDKITLRQNTFTALSGQLSDVQTALAKLNRSVSGAFDGRKATSSDETLLTASAGSSAAPGTYSLTVTGLAQAQSVVSDGFTDPGAQLKQGTFSFRVGTGATTSVTLGSSNNTLQGLSDAINNSGGDVKASIINDGSATPYRLLLTSTKTGAANTIAVTNNLTTGDGADINPLSSTITAATDATVQLGSGTGAITIRSDTNRVNNVLPGVTLNLVKADTTKPVTVTIANDTAAAKSAVQDFVDSYNKVVDFISARTGYDDTTKQAGVLLGNSDIQTLQTELGTALTSAVSGVNTTANRLSAIGVSLDEKGKLSIDSTKLDNVLSGQQAGVGINDVKRLFAFTGDSSNTGVSFILGSSKTKATTGLPYQVNVTSPATRGSVSGGEALASSIAIDGSNNTFSLSVNGKSSATLTLAAGTYTPSTLAAAVQKAINSDTNLQSTPVTVDVADGKLRFTTAQYGTAATVQIGSGTAVGTGNPLGFLGSERGVGTNVAGNFVANGKTETASGIGQVLSGDSGNTSTDGLQVLVTSAAATTADLKVTSGVATNLNNVLNKYLDPVNGRFKSIDNGYKSQIDDVTKTINRQNDILDAKKTALITQFAAMEDAVGKLKNLGTSLSALLVKSS